jgi:hypothetical protein
METSSDFPDRLIRERCSINATMNGNCCATRRYAYCPGRIDLEHEKAIGLANLRIKREQAAAKRTFFALSFLEACIVVATFVMLWRG